MTDMIDTFDEIAAGNASEVDKMKAMFEWVTQQFIEGCELDIELAKALKDRESTIRAQIRLEVMKSARKMFAICYMHLTKRGVADE